LGRLWGGFWLPWVLGVVGLVGSAGAQTSPRHPLDRDLAAIRSQYRRLGPLAWRPTLGLLVGADSNPFPGVGVERVWDVYASGTPGLGLATGLGRFLLVTLQGTVGYRYSFHYPALRGVVYTASVRGAIRLGPSKLEGGLGWNQGIYPYTPEADVPVRVRDRTLAVLWEMPLFHRMALGVTAAWSTVRVRASEETVAGYLQDLLNRRERSLATYLTWERSSRTTLRLEARRGLMDFEVDAWRNTRAYEVTLAWRYRVTSFAGAWMQVGYRLWIPEDSRVSRFQGWVGTLQADLALGRRWWLLASGERRPEWSIYVGGRQPYFVYTRIGGGLGFTLLRGVRSRVTYGRYWLEYPGGGGLLDRGHSWQGGLDFRVRSQVIGLTVGYWVRDRNLPLTADRRWTVTVGLR